MDQQNTKPCKAGQLKKGDYVCIKGKPCKIVEVTTSKTGKHGHAKAHITALDIFTNKKYEKHEPSSHNLEVPIVFKNEFDLIDMTHEGGVTYLEENGEYNESLKIDQDSELYANIKKCLESNSNIVLTVTRAMGKAHVTSFRKE